MLPTRRAIEIIHRVKIRQGQQNHINLRTITGELVRVMLNQVVQKAVVVVRLLLIADPHHHLGMPLCLQVLGLLLVAVMPEVVEVDLENNKPTHFIE
jgi:hypothetical protein